MVIKLVDIMCLKTEKAYKRGVAYRKAGDMGLECLVWKSIMEMHGSQILPLLQMCSYSK